MQWRYRRDAQNRTELYAEVPGGEYVVRDATRWEHSRVVECRDEAVLVIAGGETHLGFFQRPGRAAIEACEANRATLRQEQSDE